MRETKEGLKNKWRKKGERKSSQRLGTFLPKRNKVDLEESFTTKIEKAKGLYSQTSKQNMLVNWLCMRESLKKITVLRFNPRVNFGDWYFQLSAVCCSSNNMPVVLAAIHTVNTHCIKNPAELLTIMEASCLMLHCFSQLCHSH